MAEVTDEYIKRMLPTTKAYTTVILKAGPNLKALKPSDADKIAWELARRTFSLRADGILSIVCTVMGNWDVFGIGIFNGDLEAIKVLMDADAAVMAGVFVYDAYPCRSFPGDSLPS